MSIATLKRKTTKGGNPRVDPISGVGNNGFSLNGGHRNIGAVGQFRMVSNVTRTPFRGTEPMGHGGFDGEYYNHPSNSGDCCTNDNSIIKHSSLNTAGMLDEKYKWTKSQYPNYWVKDDDNANRMTKTQGQLTRSKTWASGACNFEKAANEDPDNVWQCKGKSKCVYWIGGKKKFLYYPYSKWLNTTKVQSQGTYITAGGVARQKRLPTPACMQHYPMMLTANGCDSNAVTWQQAQAQGLLPPDYMTCNPIDGASAACKNIAHGDVPFTLNFTLNQIATKNGNIWTLIGNATIPHGYILTIPFGETLLMSNYNLTNNGTIIIDGTIHNLQTITNNGTIQNNNNTIVNVETIFNNDTIINNGTIINIGTITNIGTIANNGTISSNSVIGGVAGTSQVSSLTSFGAGFIYLDPTLQSISDNTENTEPDNDDITVNFDLLNATELMIMSMSAYEMYMYLDKNKTLNGWTLGVKKPRFYSNYPTYIMYGSYENTSSPLPIGFIIESTSSAYWTTAQRTTNERLIPGYIDVYIIWRGATRARELMQHTKTELIDFLDAKIHKGFHEMYTKNGLNHPSPQSVVSEYIKNLLEKSGRYRIWCSGHSQGGALALINAYDILYTLMQNDYPSNIELRMYSFGAAAPGNQTFATNFNDRTLGMGIPSWRVTNKHDVGPPAVTSYFNRSVANPLNPSLKYVYVKGHCEIIFGEPYSILKGNATQNHIAYNYLIELLKNLRPLMSNEELLKRDMPGLLATDDEIRAAAAVYGL